MTDEHLISLQPGTVIAGRYEVVKCLGAGSMGLVYACRHRELSGHMVAVKVLFPEVAQDRVAAARFRNEIFASYGVSHPNVVRAYEYLRDGDIVAYTMEYVNGGDLADRLGKAGTAIPIPECVKILSQMCSGVQAIHDAGIVHRDLKPENILLTKEGGIKIADFGIARTGAGPRLTEHGGVVGTIDYVSPEYMLNSQVDWRSDIYALGILAFEMVTGESPFKGDSVYATMTKRLKTDPAAPSSIRSDCPPELDRIILKAMERNPEVRYQSAAEMMYDLQALMPEQAGGGSAFPTINRASSRSYVGPSLNNSPDNGSAGSSSTSSAASDVLNGAMSASPAPPGVKPSSQPMGDAAEALIRRATQGYGKEALVVSPPPAESLRPYEEPRSAPPPPPEPARPAPRYEARSQEKLESVLGSTSARDAQPVTFHGMDRDSIRRLSKTAKRGSRVRSGGKMVLVLGALAGVLVIGYGVMQRYYPGKVRLDEIVKATKGVVNNVSVMLGRKSEEPSSAAISVQSEEKKPPANPKRAGT